jgi:hypothetical protein
MGLTLTLAFLFLWGRVSIALPPPEDSPEEVLRTEIILEARSPVDGEPLTAAEYAELQAELQEGKYPPEVALSLQQQIFLLNLLQIWDFVNPF